MSDYFASEDMPEEGDDEAPGLGRFRELVRQLSGELDIPDADNVLARRRLEMDGFDIALDYLDEDPDAIYLQFDFGAATQGRTLRIFRLMLEANYLIYAQDQAQLGLSPDDGTVRLIVRVVMADDVDGPWLAETLAHYVEHGRYWQEHLLAAPDELFEAVAAGDYRWLRV